MFEAQQRASCRRPSAGCWPPTGPRTADPAHWRLASKTAVRTAVPWLAGPPQEVQALCACGVACSVSGAHALLKGKPCLAELREQPVHSSSWRHPLMTPLLNQHPSCALAQAYGLALLLQLQGAPPPGMLPAAPLRPPAAHVPEPHELGAPPQEAQPQLDIADHAPAAAAAAAYQPAAQAAVVPELEGPPPPPPAAGPVLLGEPARRARRRPPGRRARALRRGAGRVRAVRAGDAPARHGAGARQPSTCSTCKQLSDSARALMMISSHVDCKSGSTLLKLDPAASDI